MAMRLAELFYETRIAAGPSQTELARRMGTSQPVIARIEGADRRRPWTCWTGWPERRADGSRSRSPRPAEQTSGTSSSVATSSVSMTGSAAPKRPRTSGSRSPTTRRRTDCSQPGRPRRSASEHRRGSRRRRRWARPAVGVAGDDQRRRTADRPRPGDRVRDPADLVPLSTFMRGRMAYAVNVSVRPDRKGL